jgi:hypothetical protein
MASRYARDVDLTKKMTGVAKKFGREVKVSNLSRRLSNPRPIKRQVNSSGYDRRTSCSIDIVGGFSSGTVRGASRLTTTSSIRSGR